MSEAVRHIRRCCRITRHLQPPLTGFGLHPASVLRIRLSRASTRDGRRAPGLSRCLFPLRQSGPKDPWPRGLETSKRLVSPGRGPSWIVRRGNLRRQIQPFAIRRVSLRIPECDTSKGSARTTYRRTCASDCSASAGSIRTAKATTPVTPIAQASLRISFSRRSRV